MDTIRLLILEKTCFGRTSGVTKGIFISFFLKFQMGIGPTYTFPDALADE